MRCLATKWGRCRFLDAEKRREFWMKNRFFALVLAPAALAICCGSPLWGDGADQAAANPGKKVADFVLKDSTRHDVSLSNFKDKKAIVVVFVGTECPINNQYMVRLGELHKTYAEQGVQFLAINSNRQDTLEQVAEHARQHAIPFPVLKDEGNGVADQ